MKNASDPARFPLLTGRSPGRIASASTCAILLLGAACTSGSAKESSPEEILGDDPPSTWTAASTSGTGVTVSADPVPLRPGPLRLSIELDPEPSEPFPVTVDLVAPEMPMHGVLRYDAESVSPNAYVATVEVPMEGFWELYVNLDFGADAAVFELEVAPPYGAEPHSHHDTGSGTGTGATNTSAPEHIHGSGHTAGSDPQHSRVRTLASGPLTPH